MSRADRTDAGGTAAHDMMDPVQVLTALDPKQV